MICLLRSFAGSLLFHFFGNLAWLSRTTITVFVLVCLYFHFGNWIIRIQLAFANIQSKFLACNEYCNSTTNTCLHCHKQAANKRQKTDIVLSRLHSIADFPKPFVHKVDADHNKQGTKEKVGYVG